MGGNTHRDAGTSERLDLAEVGGDRRLAHAVEAPALVGDVEQHDRDSCLGGRLGHGKGLGNAEVVELAHSRVPGGAHLPVHLDVLPPDGLGRRPVGLLEHPVPPRPEVGAGGAPTQRPLKGVTVAVDEPGKGEGRAHDGRRYRSGCASSPPRDPPPMIGSLNGSVSRSRPAGGGRSYGEAVSGISAARISRDV